MLARLREEIVEQLGPDAFDKIAELPELPPKGTLELEQVLDSPYFFA